MKLLLMVLLFTFQILANDRPEWTEIMQREQAGGFLWFPGSGMANTLEEADLIAKGRALTAMREECGGFHPTVIFIDRYVESSRSLVTVWVRAFVKQHYECLSMHGGKVKENATLKQLYVDYQVLIAKVDTRGCNNLRDLYCAQQASDAYDAKQYYVALKYAQFSCRMKLTAGCTITGNILAKINE